MRLWHAAVRNPSGEPRHMLALAYLLRSPSNYHCFLWCYIVTSTSPPDRSRYSAGTPLVRELTIVNSTRLRNGPKPETERRCRAFCPPKSRMVSNPHLISPDPQISAKVDNQMFKMRTWPVTLAVHIVQTVVCCIILHRKSARK